MFGRNRRTNETTRPTLMTRLRGPNARHRTVKTDITGQNGVGVGGGVGDGGGGGAHTGRGYGYNQTGRSTAATGPRSHNSRRRPSIGDKLSGAMLRFKGNLTQRPREEAAGTRRMRGTEGRISRHLY